MEHATPSRPLRELTDDELEYIRLCTDGPTNIPFHLAAAAERISSLVQEEQAQR